MDVMEARRTKITPSSSHPGESRDPGIYAARLRSRAYAYDQPSPSKISFLETSSNWIPDQVRDDGRWEDDGRRGLSLLDPDFRRDDRCKDSRTIYSTSKVTPWPSSNPTTPQNLN